MAEGFLAIGIGLVSFALWAVLTAILVNHYGRAVPEALNRWAEESRYRIVRTQRRSFFRGPFVVASSMQVVYRVQVLDAAGRPWKGWILIGRYEWPRADRMVIAWDPPGPQPKPDQPNPEPHDQRMWDRELDT